MRRREFITLAGGAAAWPLMARAQQGPLGKVHRVGVLMPFEKNSSEGQRRFVAFLQGLADLGWRPGQNVRIDDFWPGIDPARVRASAEEIVALEPNVILINSALTLVPLLALTKTIPIVFTNIADPVGSGFVASLAEPAGNLTGFTPAEFSLYGKLLEVLKEVFPQLEHAGVLLNLQQAPHAGMLRAIQAAASAASVKTSELSIRDSLDETVPAFAQQPNGGLIVLPNPSADSKEHQIVELAARFRVPTIYPYGYFVRSGGLVSYGIDTADQLRRAASYVDRILRGAKAADLPVQQPTKFELLVNLKTANALDIKISPGLLARADEVIE